MTNRSRHRESSYTPGRHRHAHSAVHPRGKPLHDPALDPALRRTFLPRLLAGMAGLLQDCSRLVASIGPRSTSQFRAHQRGLSGAASRLLQRASESLLRSAIEMLEQLLRPEDYSKAPPVGGSTARSLVLRWGSVAGLGACLAWPCLLGYWLSVAIFIVTGAICWGAYAALARLWALQQSVNLLTRQLDDLANQTNSIARFLHSGSAPQRLPETINLSSGDKSDAKSLVAATLNRLRFPRLLHAMEDSPPESGAIAPEQDDLPLAVIPAEQSGEVPTVRDLMHEWHDALRRRDLPCCRQLYALLVDVAPYDMVAPLPALLKTLSSQVQKTLRREFAGHVRRRRYADALTTGEQLEQLFPDSPVAREFERIRPYLSRRVS